MAVHKITFIHLYCQNTSDKQMLRQWQRLEVILVITTTHHPLATIKYNQLSSKVPEVAKPNRKHDLK